MIPNPGVWVGSEVSEAVLGPVVVTRGASGDSGGVEAGVCTFTLINDDGAYSAIALGEQVTVCYDVADALATQRFFGQVTSVVTSWPHGIDTLSVVTVTASDAMASWTEPLKSLWAEWVERCDPWVYWPLTDGEAPAAEHGGVYADRLAVQTIGTGTADMLQWGGGTGVPTDEAATLLFENTNSSNGAYLQSVEAVWVPAAESSVTVVVVANPTASGPLVEFTTGDSTAQIDFDTSGSTYRLRTWSASAGWSSADIATGSGTKVITATLDAALVRGARVRVGGGYTISGSSFTTSLRVLPTGAVGHVLIPSVYEWLPPEGADDVVSTYLGDLVGMAIGVGETGAYPLHLAVEGTDTQVSYLPTEGVSVAELIATYAAGSGARAVVARLPYDFSNMPDLMWRSLDYTPTVVEVPAEYIVPDTLQIVRDTQGYFNTVDVTYPGGGTWAYSTGEYPIVRRALAGVMADDAATRELAAWLVNSAVRDRMPAATVDLLTMPASLDATVGLPLLALDIGDQLSITGLPAQIASTANVVIEGCTEAFGPEEWTLAFVLSPASSTDWWTLDDATLGEIDSTHRLAPL